MTATVDPALAMFLSAIDVGGIVLAAIFIAHFATDLAPPRFAPMVYASAVALPMIVRFVFVEEYRAAVSCIEVAHLIPAVESRDSCCLDAIPFVSSS